MIKYNVEDISYTSKAEFKQAVSKYVDNCEVELNEQSKKVIKNILLRIDGDVSILIESSYIDKIYRDTYYQYFSNQFFEISRSCIRFSFFKSKLTIDDFFNDNYDKLQDAFVGYSIVRPIGNGTLGKTVINPKSLRGFNGYIELAEYSIDVLGNELKVKGFPFSAQDCQILTCAETTAINILDFFSQNNQEYKSITAEDILKIIGNITYQRDLPSRGLSYEQLALIFKKSGFSPRLYFYGENNDGNLSQLELKRIFHYYVESGIPLGVAIIATKGDKNKTKVHHSIICCGHSNERIHNPSIEIGRRFSTINSADYYSKYILMDDNNYPYEEKSFDSFTKYYHPKVKGFIAPLYRRVFLEAPDAYFIAYNILQSYKFGPDLIRLNFDYIYNSESYVERYDKNNNPIVIRLFLTTSKQYKVYRKRHYPTLEVKTLYQTLEMPRCIWVAELSLKSQYENGFIFGEIIIDSTSSPFMGEKSILLINYPGKISYREPNKKNLDLFKQTSYNRPYRLYNSNLNGD